MKMFSFCSTMSDIEKIHVIVPLPRFCKTCKRDTTRWCKTNIPSRRELKIRPSSLRLSYLCVSLQGVCEGVCVVALQQPFLQIVVTELRPAGSSLFRRVSRAPQARRVHHHHWGQCQLLTAQSPANKTSTHGCTCDAGLCVWCVHCVHRRGDAWKSLCHLPQWSKTTGVSRWG